MIKILISGIDVTKSLFIRNVYYKEFARQNVDLLEVSLSNTDKEWEKWGLEINQEIEVIYTNDDNTEYRTKTMFIDDFKVIPGGFKILAKSINLESKSNTIKVWENVNLRMIFEEISKKYNFEFKPYEIENFEYSRVQQSESDFNFLNRLALREGYSVKTFDKKVILFNDKKFEKKDAVKTIKRDEILGDFYVNTNQNGKYSKVVINSTFGRIKAEDKNIIGGTKELFEEDIFLTSQVEGERFAKNLLYKLNQDYQRLTIKIDGDTSIAAGNTVNIEGFEEFDGKYFIEANNVFLDKNFFMILYLRGI